MLGAARVHEIRLWDMPRMLCFSDAHGKRKVEPCCEGAGCCAMSSARALSLLVLDHIVFSSSRPSQTPQ